MTLRCAWLLGCSPSHLIDRDVRKVDSCRIASGCGELDACLCGGGIRPGCEGRATVRKHKLLQPTKSSDTSRQAGRQGHTATTTTRSVAGWTRMEHSSSACCQQYYSTSGLRYECSGLIVRACVRACVANTSCAVRHQPTNAQRCFGRRVPAG